MLVALKEGTIEELKRRKKRKTAVTETEWPERVREWLNLPNNTRMHPGKATVSVAHGVRKPKIWLQKTRRVLMEELREQYLDEDPPSVSTLLTLIGKNYLRPGEGDRENNVCVKHSNMTHKVKKLRPLDPSLPTSSRELSGLVMCPPSETNVFSLQDPLTWKEACALR